ncbi:MAG: Ig-like domain-containing protein [Peptostreptococcales bacterium]
MKRIMVLLTALFIVMSPVISFGDTFKVESISPKDKEKGIVPSNLLMKITFSEDVSIEGNEDYFKLIDEEGNSVPISVIQGTSPNRIDIQPKDALEHDKKYSLEIDSLLKASSGNVLTEKYISGFSTEKAKTNWDVKSIALMFGILTASGFILQITKKKTDKMKEAKREARERERKKQERKEKKEKQRQRFEEQQNQEIKKKK